MPALIRTSRTLDVALAIWLLVASLESLLGPGSLLLYGLYGTQAGLQFDPVTGSPVPFGTLWEGNIFGSYCGAAFVAAFSLLVLRPVSRTVRIGLWAATAATGLGCAASQSRGAWIGVVAGLATILIFGRPRAVVIRATTLSAAALAATVAVLAPAWKPVGDGLTRLAALGPGALAPDATTAERLYTLSASLRISLAHPFFGTGAGSFASQVNYLNEAAPAWVSNLELHAFHDGGLLALTGACLAFVILPVIALRRLPTWPTAPVRRATLLATVAAVIVLLVAFQATEASWLAYSWVSLALLERTMSLEGS